MSSTFKNNLTLSVFGESHQPTMGIVVEGLPVGFCIDTDFIDKELQRRRPQSQLSTDRIEHDEYEFISGYFNQKTTGAPLCILVKNKNYQSNDYRIYPCKYLHNHSLNQCFFLLYHMRQRLLNHYREKFK